MRLRHISKNPQHDHERDCSEFKPFHYERVRVDFLRFGAGEERKPDFRASFTWADVEALIEVFAATKNPDAIRVTKALALASALENFSKSN